MYDHTVGLTFPERDEPIGPVLYREDEDLVSCTRMDTSVKIYHHYDIKKFFGLTFNEFMDLPGWQSNVLIENAEEFMKELSNNMNEVEEEVGKNKKEMNEVAKVLDGNNG